MTVFVMGLICIGAAAFLVRFFIALCSDGLKIKCEVMHVERSPYTGVRVCSIHVMQPQEIRTQVSARHSEPRYSQAR